MIDIILIVTAVTVLIVAVLIFIVWVTIKVQ